MPRGGRDFSRLCHYRKMTLIRCLCAGLLLWQATSVAAQQSLFATAAAEFDARSKQIDAARDPEARGKATLEWLRALDAVLAAIPFGGPKEAEQAWLDKHENLAVYGEPAGEWLIPDVVIWAAHAKNKGTAAADDIAWLAVTNGLAGECEGYVPCYTYGMNRLEGEYLRRHPQGRHRREALDKVNEMVTIVVDDLLTRPEAKDYLNVPGDCADMLKNLRPLRQAVATAQDAQTTKTLALIDRLIAACSATVPRG